MNISIWLLIEKLIAVENLFIIDLGFKKVLSQILTKSEFPLSLKDYGSCLGDT